MLRKLAAGWLTLVGLVFVAFLVHQAGWQFVAMWFGGLAAFGITFAAIVRIFEWE